MQRYLIFFTLISDEQSFSIDKKASARCWQRLFLTGGRNYFFGKETFTFFVFQARTIVCWRRSAVR